MAVCRGESKALFEKITVRHLLTNTSGLVSTDSAVWGQWRASGDWIKFLFDRPMLHEPGKVFEYSTGNTHLLAAIVQRTTKLAGRRLAGKANRSRGMGGRINKDPSSQASALRISVVGPLVWKERGARIFRARLGRASHRRPSFKKSCRDFFQPRAGQPQERDLLALDWPSC